eukprot:2974920-Rhodomonas_salina.1
MPRMQWFPVSHTKKLPPSSITARPFSSQLATRQPDTGAASARWAVRACVCVCVSVRERES